MHDTVPKKKKKKSFKRFIYYVFHPSHDRRNKWWQRLHHKQKAYEKNPYTDWTTLSPNEPPLPFLIPKTEASSSRPAPINKSSRELYTIVESSETHSDNNSSNSGVQEESSSKYQASSDLIADNLNSSNLVYHHIPICDWPMSNQSPEPVFNIQLKGNEHDCKIIFSQLFLEAYRQQTYKLHPKEMHILLDEERAINGITLILSDNSREDYIELKGSMQYIPPELFVSCEYKSNEVDVWSLGISLYKMMVGRYPFQNNSLEKIRTYDYEIPNTLSVEVRDLIQRLISPQDTRATFDMILSHPWIKSYLQQHQQPRPQPQFKSTSSTKSTMSNWERVRSLITHILVFIFKGPYPPPTFYRELDNLKQE